MKKITILGEEFEYERHYDEIGYNYSSTRFYQGTEEIIKRKYIFFGEKITKVVPKKVFLVGFWIENPNWTKEELRKKLEREVKILNRAKEIERGELI